jgi:type VI secretion system protein ImpA
MDPAVARLVEPIDGEHPCGVDLEDTPLLASFDAYRVFGQMTAPPGDSDWREIRDKALEGLEQSRDLRLLSHLAAASLRTDGLQRFCDVLHVAARWLDDHPDHVFPRVDEDAILRKNALNGFSDRMAIVDAVRRQPFVMHPQLGAFALRHFEIASGKLAPAEADGEPPTEAQLSATLEGADGEKLVAMEASLAAAVEGLRRVESSMRNAHGAEGTPEFEPLLGPLVQIHKLLADQLAARAASAAPVEGAEAGAGGEPGAAAIIGVGSIRSRDDAMRALDAVAEFFRKNEPSSPLPMMVERARRLIGKDFLELLSDLAPDGLDQAKHVGGVRDE